MPQGFNSSNSGHQVIDVKTPDGHYMQDQKLHKMGTNHVGKQFGYPASVERATGEYLGAIAAREDSLRSSLEDASNIFQSLELDKKNKAEEDASTNLQKQLPGATPRLIQSVVDSRRRGN